LGGDGCIVWVVVKYIFNVVEKAHSVVERRIDEGVFSHVDVIPFGGEEEAVEL
jgi:hypothetical protein